MVEDETAYLHSNMDRLKQHILYLCRLFYVVFTFQYG